MYRFLVASKVRGSFAALSQGDCHPALKLMAADCQYQFVGDHALGGSRSNRALIEQWFLRFLRILPRFQFQCEDVMVVGWPWSTKIAVRLAVSWTSPTGEVYQNQALQMVWLKWFKAVKVLTIDDSRAFGDLLQKVAHQYGTPEAAAEPIVG